MVNVFLYNSKMEDFRILITWYKSVVYVVYYVNNNMVEI